jgi:spermidine synthase
VQLAEICFGIVFDERMKIALQNGREHLATFPERHFDIILLDSFSGMGEHPNALSTVEFYQLCKSRMTDDAVIATNLIDNNPYHQQKIATFCAAFKFSYQYEYNGVTILFASDVNAFTQKDFKQKAIEIAEQYQFEFPYSENTEYLSACDTKAFSSALLQDESIAKF